MEKDNKSNEKVLLYLILILPSLLVYSQGFGYDFIEIDDGGQILENNNVKNFSFKNIANMFTTSVVSMYQPFTTLLFSIIALFFGIESAAPFNVLSYLLHVINIILVYRIGQKLGFSDTLAIILASLFGTHPLMVESVSWISATSTLLSTLFVLLAWYHYLTYLNLQVNQSSEDKKNYYLCLLFFVCGALSKVIALPFLGVVFLTDYLFKKELFSKENLQEKIPFFVIAIIFALVAFHFRGSQDAFPNYNYKPIYLVPDQLFWYIQKAFIPYNLGVMYDWPIEFGTLSNLITYIGLAIILGVAYFFKSRRLFWVGVFFYGGNIILHTSFVSTLLAPYADRYAYMSTLGIWIALLALIKNVPSKYTKNIFGAVILIYTFVAYNQVQHWSSTAELWSHNLTHQNATFSNGMRGAIYYQRGQNDLAKADFETFIANPDTRYELEKYAYIYNALAFMSLDSVPELSAAYSLEALNFVNQPVYYQNAGVAFSQAGMIEEAKATYIRCIMEFPSHVPTYESLMALYFEEGSYEEILPLLDVLITNNVNAYSNYLRSATIELMIGNFENAKQDVEAAKTIMQNNNVPFEQDPQLLELMRQVEGF